MPSKTCKKDSAKNSAVKTLKLSCSQLSNRQLQLLCGSLDEHLAFIEDHYHVRIHRQGNIFLIHGPKDKAHKALRCLDQLATQSMSQTITLDIIRSMVFECPAATGRSAVVSPRHLSQKKYIEKIAEHSVTFGVGPAGTGKTYLAVAEAVRCFREQEIDRILLTRPAVEAGEKLGFLPGDLQQKVDPYLRPLFDALNELMGTEYVNRLVTQQAIEVAPLAFMRGRTLSRSFIILDEAQNTTQNQMKLFLTRLGEGSKMVITGDISQIDLPDPRQSGLREAIKVLKDLPEIGFHFFQKGDIVRHPLVTKIIESYDHAGA